MLLCLFDGTGAETRLALPEYDAGIWHGFVDGVGVGQAYGYRATGPWDPARGVRCNPAKLLLDPYARATTGPVRFGPEVLGHDVADPDRASQLDSAGHVPRSLVVDSAFDWHGGARPHHRYADTTGTGNAVNAGNPVCLRLIMDSLRYWITEMGVDGFRFDLAPTLAREDGGLNRMSAFFDLVAQDRWCPRSS
jgi:pullulanase/glycogen debranching enzyme